MMMLISTAHAQSAATAPAGGGIMQFVPLIAIFFVFYFLMIRPQKKQQEEQMKFLSALKKGDEVFTKSGLMGTISGLTDKVVTLELDGGVKVKHLRSQIGGSSANILKDKEEKK